MKDERVPEQLGDILQHGAVFLVVTILLRQVFIGTSKARPHKLLANAGSIRPSVVLTSVVTIASAGVGIAALYAAVTTDANPGAAVVGFLMTTLAVACATSYSTIYEVRWDQWGIEGPASFWPPPFGPGHTRLPWSQITSAGRAPGGYFVADEAGNKVCWNESYSGYGFLMAHIECRCPHLFPPEDDLATPDV